jgi:intein/homing endonuclease
MSWNQIRKIASTNENVCKYVFSKDDCVVESVLYRYPTFKDRTVICCSTMSGCNVGCRFCFLPNQLVDTPNGKVEINKLTIYDKVYGPTGLQDVRNVINREYDGEIIELELENGQVINVTSDHPMILVEPEIILFDH